MEIALDEQELVTALVEYLDRKGKIPDSLRKKCILRGRFSTEQLGYGKVVGWLTVTPDSS